MNRFYLTVTGFKDASLTIISSLGCFIESISLELYLLDVELLSKMDDLICNIFIIYHSKIYKKSIKELKTNTIIYYETHCPIFEYNQ